jgi:hypothetical protein
MSAKSFEGVVRAPEDVPPEERGGDPATDQDKPDYPPHERHTAENADDEQES